LGEKVIVTGGQTPLENRLCEARYFFWLAIRGFRFFTQERPNLAPEFFASASSDEPIFFRDAEFERQTV
jgi:hypothetical protein